MEGKLIIYIIIGVLYFLYSLGKKAEQKKQEAQAKNKPASTTTTTTTAEAPSTLEDIIREIKRKQAEIEQKKAEATKPKPAYQKQPVQKPQPKPQRDILVHEKKKPAQVEGFSSYESVFERELTDEEKIERGNIKLANEGIYRIETLDEVTAREEAEAKANQINIRDAVIGSLILERKY